MIYDDTPTDRLDTGEPITIRAWPDGRYEAVALVPDLPGAVDHHALGGTPAEAVALLQHFVSARRRAPSAAE